ncbi:DNA-binding transcriptional regulator LsrR (DeoR family) [Limimaricola variabilis]|jgi:DNA-binding transcriptional regulator LsrR (DeoR family)|uniref:DNA-binding transcriptional regulator LsrR (DeoR family) n=1 Tax=Limimaricola variabilis TaxID=1492771 RepID=A0ABR6HIU6_9RHOB|nr:sugar-binding transcriptional regulator [Limimaricola variabilis]MBB3710478.1 DNA-binding transcriptional regulator LsrR (DeoR family) [Limimaricola variabilis]
MNQHPAAPAVRARTSDNDRLRSRAVWLYYAEGLKQSEIAKILDVTRVTVVRLLADARRRNEVRITIRSPLTELAGTEFELRERYGIDEVILAPVSAPDADPTPAIAAAAGAWISSAITANMTVGVGWGRTLHSSLPFITGRSLEDLKVISLLGGIAAARRFNPAEFAWQFAEMFQGEGYLISAPALVDSPETKHALLERCGLASIFEMADKLDLAIFSTGGITQLTTSYRTGHLSEAERESLIEAGAVGDILYNFIDADGQLVDHPINQRAISADLKRLRAARTRLLVSGGADKHEVMRAAIAATTPNVLITDEETGRALCA